jgi:hypothetical protein
MWKNHSVTLIIFLVLWVVAIIHLVGTDLLGSGPESIIAVIMMSVLFIGISIFDFHHKKKNGHA